MEQLIIPGILMGLGTMILLGSALADLATKKPQTSLICIGLLMWMMVITITMKDTIAYMNQKGRADSISATSKKPD